MLKRKRNDKLQSRKKLKTQIIYLNFDCLVEIADVLDQDDVVEFAGVNKEFYLAVVRARRIFKTSKVSICTSLFKVKRIINPNFKKNICKWAAHQGNL